MKLTNQEAMDAQLSIKGLRGDIPIEVSWALAELSVKLYEITRIFNAAADSLRQEYEIETEVQPDGSVMATSKIDGNAQRFGEKFNELLALEIELAVNGKIKLPKTASLHPGALAALMRFVEL